MSNQTDIPKKKTREGITPFLRFSLKWGTRFILLLFFLFFVGWGLLKVPSVQKKAVAYTENLLSTEMKTKVEIKSISLSFFDRLVLDSFLVYDLKGDSLLFVEHLTADLNSYPISWIYRNVILEDVKLQGADLKINRLPEENRSNLNEYIAALKPKKKKNRKPFFLDLETLYLDDINVVSDDLKKGELQKYILKSGIIEVEEIDISGNRFLMDDIELNELYVSIEKINRDTAYLKTKTSKTSPSEPDSTGLFVFAESLEVINGTFKFDHNRYERREWPDNVFNNRHWIASNIDMLHENLTFENDVIKSKVKSGSLKTGDNEFEISEFESEVFEFSDSKLAFYDLDMETPHSQIGDSMVFKFRGLKDFSNFNNKVYITANLSESMVGFKDILFFSEPLNRNRFFLNNEKEYLKIDGQLKGKINSLKGYDLAVELGDGLRFNGDFRSRDIAVKDEEYLDLEVNNLRTTINTLYELVPSFSPPENFRKLGQLNFKGNFVGFLNDFVAFGDLKSDLGRATMDMNLNVRSGRETAEYSGHLNLDHFDLGKWSGNPDLGYVTFNSQVQEGKGLTASSANAKLSANVDTFSYKNYQYENIKINGELASELFEGNLEIHDDNIDLTFNGNINFKDSVPHFDFESNINILDLNALNISKEKFVFSGAVEMDIKNQKFSKMEGKVAVRSFAMTKGEESYRADSIIISNNFTDFPKKVFKVESDILRGHIDGVFDLEQIPNAFVDYYVRNFPKFMDKFGIKKPVKEPKPASFDFELEVLDLKNFPHLISGKLDSLKGLKTKGYFDSYEDKLKLDVFAPLVDVAGWRLADVGLQNKLNNDEGHLNFSVFQTKKGKTELSPIIMFGLLESDTLEFGLTHTFNFQTLEDLNLDGKFFISDNYYQVNFDPSTLVIGKHEWEIPALNYLRFDKNSIQTKNFQLKNENKSIVVESYNNNKGLKFDFRNFNLDFIEELWSYKPLDFSGNFRLNGQIADIFKLKGIGLQAKAESFLVNEDDFGGMDLDVKLKDLKSVMRADFSLVKGKQKLIASGKYLLPSASKALKESGRLNVKEPNYYDIDFDVINYPIAMLEYWVPDGISNTSGTITSTDLKIFGYPREPHISGTAVSKNGKTTINYLNTTYSIEKGVVDLNDQMFDASGSILHDTKGNPAYVTGGLTHIFLKKLGLDCRVKADRFEVLNTRKNDKAPFYGNAIGQGDIQFSGNFKQTDITVNATTGKGTNINIPVVSDYSTSELTFIKFVDKKKNQREIIVPKSATLDLRGINLEMQLNVTEDANMKLIFDEKIGDVIEGTGRGNIEMKVLRDGTFSMNGDYNIEQGEYLFTMLNVVNKHFKIQPGGSIRWFGDPFGADINIVAQYDDLKAPVSNLIIEYLTLMPVNLRREAGQATPISLTMLLQGQLLKPNISFDIEFPNLTGELNTYAQSKLRVMKQDQNDLNRQVFGLIVTGNFLPETFQLNGTDVAFTTLSELISNQISIYLTDIFQELIDDLKYFSGIDIDLAYSTFQNLNLTSNTDNFGSTESSVSLNLKPYFFDNRLSVNVGGQFNVDDNTSNPQVRAGRFSAGDFIVEYAISKDKRLKLKAYASTEYVLEGQKTRYGGGLSYRREFDTFKELFSGLKKGIRGIKK